MEPINNKNLINKYFHEYNLDEILTPGAMDISQLVEFMPGETILKTGDNLESYYIFLTGRLKVYSTQDNGKYLLLKFYSGFDSLGDIELINGMKVSSTVIAVKKSLLLKFPAKELKDMLYDYPPFLRYSLDTVSRKLHDLSNHSAYNQLYPLKNRLASFIRGQLEGDEVILTDKLIDIAEYLGTTYRHLSRELNHLEDDRIIERNKNRIRVVDVEKLKKLAGNIY